MCGGERRGWAILSEGSATTACGGGVAFGLRIERGGGGGDVVAHGEGERRLSSHREGLRRRGGERERRAGEEGEKGGSHLPASFTGGDESSGKGRGHFYRRRRA